ncbi:A/G-specific adenine glycosylase [Curvibacter sp. RS43]|uniref:A/G-specific adenine glycosylase n=1 Tax=Curvibacter microcysteis TaxID=3026419 RepID=UPI00236115A3|nr:A/G-specific adenine glycosylase [Curvibacter sp. RS43]MDD0810443.1 A/G-specific adenine glycosylase [Curvibacter sp. RS43]
MTMETLAQRVVRWQRAHGRHDLPWQNTRDPYRVWLSEIMLQQTQVSTVLDYFPRFLARFPDVAALAQAEQDEVLGLWSGLGYYSRARNLHACARQVMSAHGGAFPRSAEALATLPGIGRSTAAAIASFCFEEQVAILDGNVKRVLTRALAFDGDLAVAAEERRLWALATDLLPVAAPSEPGQAWPRSPDMPAYTQGLMDLGATVCSTRKPSCLLCPLQPICRAQAAGEPERYPVRTRKLKRRAERWWLLLLQGAHGEVWLQQRPQKGIWAGMDSLPVFEDEAGLKLGLQAALGCAVTLDSAQVLEPFLHVLTHRDLYLHPVCLRVPAGLSPQVDVLPGRWLGADVWPTAGLPTPIRKVLVQQAGAST